MTPSKTASEWSQLFLDGLISLNELHTAICHKRDIWQTVDKVEDLKLQLIAAESDLATLKETDR